MKAKVGCLKSSRLIRSCVFITLAVLTLILISPPAQACDQCQASTQQGDNS